MKIYCLICSSPCLILSLIEICKGHDAHMFNNEAESSVSIAGVLVSTL